MILTPRQKEIAQLVARGLSNKAIADSTGIAYNTVENHIRQAADRLEFDGRPRHKLTLFVVLNAPDV